MKRIIKIIAVSLMTLLFTSVPTLAAEDTTDGFWQDFLDTVPNGVEAPEYEDIAFNVGVESILAEIIGAVSSGGGEAFSFFVMLLGIAVLISVAESAADDKNPLFKHAGAAVSVISAVLIFGRIGRVCFSVKESLDSLIAFFSGVIPVLCGILAAGGSVNTAAHQALNMNITLGAISYLSASLLIPLVFSLFALALAQSVDGGGVSAVAKWIKSMFTWLVGIATAVIIGALSMQSIIAGAEDSAYLRAAKYAANGMIPVVGSTVSAALGTLTGGLGYMKSALGVSSVAVIITLALTPLVTMLLYRLAFSTSISFLEFVDAKGGVRVFSAFRTALDTLISVYALSCVVCICEIVIFIKSGVSVFG